MRLSDNTTAFVHPDFIPRAYSRPIRELSLAYIVATVLIFLASTFSDSLGGDMVSGVIIAFLIAAIATYTILRRQQHNDQMMATEFENLLFSAAAGLGSAFCIFLKSDGTVVYANDGARRAFNRISHKEVHALESLLTDANVDKADRDKLFSALARSHKENLIVKIKNQASEVRDFILTLEPLKRPAGYFVLRGREYYADRKAAVHMSGALQRTTPDKVASLLQQVPSPLYIVSDTGVLEYVNPALEQFAGYGEHELVESGMTLRKLIYHADGFETGEFDPVEFHGAVLISCRNGSLAKAQLSQIVCMDEHGRPNGCCGILYP